MFPSHSLNSWSRMAGPLREKALRCILMGLLLGTFQKAAYTLADKAQWGTTLLMETISFNTLCCLVILLMLARAFLAWKGKVWKLRFLRREIRKTQTLIVDLTCGPSLISIGFGLSALLDGHIHAAWLTLLFALYLLSIGEVSATPLFRKNSSKLYPFALGAMIIIPFS